MKKPSPNELEALEHEDWLHDLEERKRRVQEPTEEAKKLLKKQKGK